MPQTKITQVELNLSKTVDANGWTVLDMGTFKIYCKKISTTLSAFSGPAFISALGSTLPVGIANFNSLIDFSATFIFNASGSLRLTEEAMAGDSTIAVVGTTTAASNSTIVAYYKVIA